MLCQESFVAEFESRGCVLVEDVLSEELVDKCRAGLERAIEMEADMVVLSAGLVPTDGTEDLAGKLGIELSSDGFFKEIYSKLRPVETKVKGIFICGGAQGPKDIPESITQAEAAAFQVLLNFSKAKSINPSEVSG